MRLILLSSVLFLALVYVNAGPITITVHKEGRSQEPNEAQVEEAGKNQENTQGVFKSTEAPSTEAPPAKEAEKPKETGRQSGDDDDDDDDDDLDLGVDDDDDDDDDTAADDDDDDDYFESFFDDLLGGQFFYDFS